jgi:hypothetical protein
MQSARLSDGGIPMNSIQSATSTSKSVRSWTQIAVAIVFCLAATAATAQQKIYKWTDANGQTHYSSQPPKDQKAQTVRQAKEPTPVVPATTAATADGAAATTTGDKPAMSDADRARLTDYCKTLRTRVSQLQKGGQFSESNPDGSARPLNNADVNRMLSTDQANETKYCTANGI